MVDPGRSRPRRWVHRRGRDHRLGRCHASRRPWRQHVHPRDRAVTAAPRGSVQLGRASSSTAGRSCSRHQRPPSRRGWRREGGDGPHGVVSRAVQGVKGKVASGRASSSRPPRRRNHKEGHGGHDLRASRGRRRDARRSRRLDRVVRGLLLVRAAGWACSSTIWVPGHQGVGGSRREGVTLQPYAAHVLVVGHPYVDVQGGAPGSGCWQWGRSSREAHPGLSGLGEAGLAARDPGGIVSLHELRKRTSGPCGPTPTR